jgi:F-type H+-transporting ATPase subunit gamma
MATLIDYRRRIRSVKNTRQLTRAMKFVAAARLRRAQERVLAARPYAAQILRVLRSAVARMENPQHPLMARRPENRILVVMVSGDRGLAGAFNANAVRRGMEFLREHAAQELQIIAIGKKARDAFRKSRWPILRDYLGISSQVDFAQAKEISAQIQELYASLKTDAVYAVYNEPHEAIFSRLVPRYVETEVHRVMLESAAAEQAARMTAMDNATNNAAELIDELTLDMNKIRQAAITKEIIEVVSGAASTAR